MNTLQKIIAGAGICLILNGCDLPIAWYAQKQNQEKQQDKKPNFPLDKILTVSLDDYCMAKNEYSCSYDLKGVHYERNLGEGGVSMITNFAKNVPANAEIVVDFKYSVAELAEFASGTALIPKKKEKK